MNPQNPHPDPPDKAPDATADRATAMPETAQPGPALLDRIRRLACEHDWPWRQGRSFGLVYDLDDDHTQLLNRAYQTLCSANAVSPTAFPSAAALEREVLAMVADLLHAPPTATRGDDGADPARDDSIPGAMTSGGSESTLLALKAYRDHARASSPGTTEPTIVLPNTAHAAFLKAAHYLDLTPIVIEPDASGRAAADAYAEAMDERTILLIASAPCLPYGTVDAIESIGALARDRGVGLHVDACLGGFVLPFLEELGEAVPPFDFRVDGVGSITVDLHKYAFAAKGASVTVYRDRSVYERQWFATDAWCSGPFASEHVTGTRPGGTVAAAWVALRALGRAGYREIASTVMRTTARLRRGIEGIEGLRIVGEPAMSVFAFTSETARIASVVERMGERGWRLNRQANPEAIHMIVTPRHEPVVDEFLADLGEAVAEAERIADNGQPAPPAAVYGLAVGGGSAARAG